MAAAVLTVTKPSDIKGEWTVGNRKFKVRDITTDTGNYASGGFTLTASQFGLKHIDFVLVGSASTSGSAGATALPLGVIYGSGGTSFTLQAYEGSAAGTILGEKTNAEAMPSNQTVRVVVAGQ